METPRTGTFLLSATHSSYSPLTHNTHLKVTDSQARRRLDLHSTRHFYLSLSLSLSLSLPLFATHFQQIPQLTIHGLLQLPHTAYFSFCLTFSLFHSSLTLIRTPTDPNAEKEIRKLIIKRFEFKSQ